MNRIKQAVIKADPRMKGIIVVMIAYLAIVFTALTVGAASQIEDYVQTVAIQVQDGNNPVKDYLVKQDTVENVLEEVSVQVGPQDIVSKPLDYTVNKGDFLSILHVRNAEVEELEEVGFNQRQEAGLHLFTTEVTEGAPGQTKNVYKVTYENGKEINKELIKTEVVQEPKDAVVSVGTVQTGAYFTGRLTKYGGDCLGCSGKAATGISLSASTGVNGSNTAKLSYNGGSYYCLAADSSIPFGTIIKITNHNLSIEEEAYGIVVDRGGAINGNKIDIYQGSESGHTYFSGGTSPEAQFEIVSVGSGDADFWK